MAAGPTWGCSLWMSVSAISVVAIQAVAIPVGVIQAVAIPDGETQAVAIPGVAIQDVAIPAVAIPAHLQEIWTSRRRRTLRRRR